MATLAEVIEQAIDHAVSGSDPDSNVIQKLRKEAQSLEDQAIQELGREVALNQWLRARMTKEFPLALTNGVGAVPATLLVEFLHEGIVKDESDNILHRVKSRNALINYQFPYWGYYCIDGDTSGVSNFYTRQINTGDLTATASLTIIAPHIPTRANLNTEIPDELINDLVVKIAMRLRGYIAGMEAKAA